MVHETVRPKVNLFSKTSAVPAKSSSKKTLTVPSARSRRASATSDERSQSPLRGGARSWRSREDDSDDDDDNENRCSGASGQYQDSIPDRIDSADAQVRTSTLNPDDDEFGSSYKGSEWTGHRHETVELNNRDDEDGSSNAGNLSNASISEDNAKQILLSGLNKEKKRNEKSSQNIDNLINLVEGNSVDGGRNQGKYLRDAIYSDLRVLRTDAVKVATMPRLDKAERVTLFYRAVQAANSIVPDNSKKYRILHRFFENCAPNLEKISSNYFSSTWKKLEKDG